MHRVHDRIKNANCFKEVKFKLWIHWQAKGQFMIHFFPPSQHLFLAKLPKEPDLICKFVGLVDNKYSELLDSKQLDDCTVRT